MTSKTKRSEDNPVINNMFTNFRYMMPISVIVSIFIVVMFYYQKREWSIGMFAYTFTPIVGYIIFGFPISIILAKAKKIELSFLFKSKSAKLTIVLLLILFILEVILAL